MPPEGLQLRESLLLLIDLTEGPLASVRSLLRANLRDARQRGSCPSGLRRGLFQTFRLVHSHLPLYNNYVAGRVSCSPTCFTKALRV
jgi:hypothetical protein